MKKLLQSLACLAGLASVAGAGAFEADQVTVAEMSSFNENGHLWVKINANNNCSIPTPYFIIQRWDNVAEPMQSARKQMYQLALTALAAGKQIRVVGVSCYLDRYLFADQVKLYE